MRFLYDVIDPKPLPQSYLVHFGVNTDHLGALSGPFVKNQIVRRHRTGAPFFYTGVKPMSTYVSRKKLIFVRRHRSKATSKTALRPMLGQLGAILGSSWPILGPSWGHLGGILGPSWGICGFKTLFVVEEPKTLCFTIRNGLQHKPDSRGTGSAFCKNEFAHVGMPLDVLGRILGLIPTVLLSAAAKLYPKP